MKRDDVAARPAEILDVLLGFHDHQVGVEAERREFAQVADDFRTPGEVGHEAPVHHVEVEIVGAGALHERDLFRDLAEVSGEE